MLVFLLLFRVQKSSILFFILKFVVFSAVLLCNITQVISSLSDHQSQLSCYSVMLITIRICEVHTLITKLRNLLRESINQWSSWKAVHLYDNIPIAISEVFCNV